MLIDPLLETTKKYLRLAGWYEGRRIDTSIYELRLAKEISNPPSTVIEFLSEFGRLRVELYDSSDDIAFKDWFVIDPIIALEGRDICWVKSYSTRTSRQLWPVGEAFRDHAILLMDETGKVYGGYDDEFWEIANSGRAAIEAIRNKSHY